MFNDDKKNSPSPESVSSVDTKLSFNDAKPAQPENIPIYTMKKDLQNINNNQYFSDSNNSGDVSAETIRITPAPARSDSRLRTSPFLSQDVKKESVAMPVSAPSNEQINIKAGPAPHTPSSWGKLILITVVIFLLFAAGAGGYYFWINKKSAAKIPTSTTVSPPKSTLALDKPNYLNVDTSSEKIDIASAIDKYVREVTDEKPNTPVEFIVVDNQNNPILFKDFASKSGLSLPKDITGNLKDTFSLFIYLDEEQPRIGLAVDSNDLVGINLKDALLKNETSLISNMTSLYLGNSVNTDDTPFTTSYYGGAEIRYKNIPIPTMSLDYTIFRDKLIIGTSKMTARSIIDYLTANGKVQGVEDVIDGIPEEDLQNGNL
ncbi:MAG: hypothetical protein WCV59_01670 [Parcubacteria group bacterium]|jgi:hypothetical protein